MFGKYNGFVSKARVSACMYFLVFSRIQQQDIPKVQITDLAANQK
jgi:hypothetical protein